MSQAKNPFRSAEAEALLKDNGRLRELLRSPETKRLMELLKSQNGSALQQAAQRARQGDCAGLNAMLQNLMETGEGARLAEKLSADCAAKK